MWEVLGADGIPCAVWRLAVGLSLIPAFGTLYQRLTLGESTRFKDAKKLTQENRQADEEIRRLKEAQKKQEAKEEVRRARHYSLFMMLTHFFAEEGYR